MDLLKGLNDRQLEAVYRTEGPLLIVAGAGSGKTKVLTSKIAYLIQQKGIDNRNILAITFTNKAASEMRNRIQDMIGQDVDGMWVGTFHAVCSRILRRHISVLGYNSNFTIYDRDDQKTVLKEIYQELNFSEDRLSYASVIAVISTIKNQTVSSDQYSYLEQNFDLDQRFREIYQLYEKKLKRYNALDFDDLIVKTLELFAQDQRVLEYYQTKFKYIFVDEYQDTNHNQYQLVKLLAGGWKNLCVVGDGDQAIYSWRGADVSNLNDFKRDFTDAITVLLEENYRSTPRILETANKLISHNQNRIKKNLWTSKLSGKPVIYKEVDHENGEPITVIEWIDNMVYDGYKLSDMAILYRTNAQSRAFEEALMFRSIPYRIVGGQRFYDRKEIKDIIAYLKLLVNPDDNISLKRIINTPKRGIGSATIEKLEELARIDELSIFGILKNQSYQLVLGNRLCQKLNRFVEMMDSLRASMLTLSVTDIVKELIHQTGYLEELIHSNTVESRSRMENIDSFVSSIAAYEETNPENGLDEYLASVSLLSDIDKTDESKTGINMMTIHAAKGLEFKVVFVTGLEEGIFPNRRAMEAVDGLEEERRLCYVAVTRARERLFLSSTTLRRIYGKLVPSIQSRFVGEMKDTFEDVTSHRTEKIQPLSCDQNVYNMKNNLRYSILDRKESLQNATKDELRTGDKINHKSWGVGIVISVVKQADGDELVIHFDKKGIKKLNRNLAPITKVI